MTLPYITLHCTALHYITYVQASIAARVPRFGRLPRFQGRVQLCTTLSIIRSSTAKKHLHRKGSGQKCSAGHELGCKASFSFHSPQVPPNQRAHELTSPRAHRPAATCSGAPGALAQALATGRGPDQPQDCNPKNLSDLKTKSKKKKKKVFGIQHLLLYGYELKSNAPGSAPRVLIVLFTIYLGSVVDPHPNKSGIWAFVRCLIPDRQK